MTKCDKFQHCQWKVSHIHRNGT